LTDIAEGARVLDYLAGAASGTTGDAIWIDGGLHDMA
jgi:hypothetical protein